MKHGSASLLGRAAVACVLLGVGVCVGAQREGMVVKSDEDWRASLTPEQYRIARKKGTERAFTGKYWNLKSEGTYVCVCCGQPLFASRTKYDSGTGWPSFWAPIEDGSVAEEVDSSLGMARTEAQCARCGAHLGHVFSDGPRPTGQRYCINSASLNFVGEQVKAPEGSASGGQGEMVKLAIGDPAPGFSLRDQQGREVALGDFAGRKLLVYFYPKAATPGCTRQACAVRDAKAELDGAGAAAVGISPDKPDAQGKFDRKYELGFPLLSDSDHAVAEAYGAWGEKVSYGKRSVGIVRSAFLVGEDGKLQGVWYGVKPEQTVENVLSTVK